MKLLRIALVFFSAAVLTFGQEIKRPTADSDASGFCGGTSTSSTAMPQSWDAAGLTTSSNQSSTGGSCRLFQSGICKIPGYNYSQGRKFTNWQTTTTSYVSLTLNINSQGTTGVGTADQACTQYSTNGGVSYTSIRCTSTSWGEITDSVTLNPAQDLSQLAVRVCVEGTGATNFSPSTTSVVTVWDIWTLGSTSGGNNNGNGSGSGHQPDPIYIAFFKDALKLIASFL